MARLEIFKYLYKYRVTFNNLSTYAHITRDSPNIQYSCTSNGLTVATEERECRNVCIGLYVDAGSRLEKNTLNGIIHFFQHIVYKSTNMQPKTELELEMSNMGAKFRCFTTRDTTAFYVECLAEFSTRALAILFNCIFNNAYAEAEIEIQRNIIYQEMMEHERNPTKVVHDYLHSTAFHGTPLSQSVMGLSSNLNNFKPHIICDNIMQLLDPNKMVLATVGGVRHDVIGTWTEQYFKWNCCSKCDKLGPSRYTGSQVVYRDDSMDAAYVAIAVEGPSFGDVDKKYIDCASSMIGGWDASQPGGINHGTRVAHIASAGKFCKSYKAFTYYYQDTGLWGVEFIAPKLEIDDMVMTIQEEWMRLCVLVTDGELIRAKNELKSKIIMRHNSTVDACHDLGQNILRACQQPPLLERLHAVDSVTAKDLKIACDKYLYDRCPVVVGMGPTECLLPYSRIRSYMYWLRL